mgnify:CR=1 FL=1
MQRSAVKPEKEKVISEIKDKFKKAKAVKVVFPSKKEIQLTDVNADLRIWIYEDGTISYGFEP